MYAPSLKRRRSGFTLIEVLVAAGLCMLIMVVMTQAFAAGIDTFSILKSTGELQERLATANSILQNDLNETHLIDANGSPLKVSNVRFDHLNKPYDPLISPYAIPPRAGFFRIIQETVSQSENTDTDQIPSTYANNHILQMTVRRTPSTIDGAFLSKVPSTAWNSTNTLGLSANAIYRTNPPVAGDCDFGYRLKRECLGAFSGNAINTDIQFASEMAEVTYFLKPSKVLNVPDAQTIGTRRRELFSLHRRVKLLAKHDNNITQLNWLPYQQISQNISMSPEPILVGGTPFKFVNGPGDITVPENRTGGKAGRRVPIAFPIATEIAPVFPYTTAYIDSIGPSAANATDISGDDILLSNVISFEIKANWDAGLGAFSPGWNTPNEVPFDDLPPYQSQAISATYPNGSGNPSFSRSIDPTKPRVFDTWTDRAPHNNWDRPETLSNPGPPPVFNPNPSYVPLPIRLKAIQIKLRIYDPKNKLARQITLIQDM